MRNSDVIVYAGAPIYPQVGPFHPHDKYPEYELLSISTEPNFIYDAVRECLSLSGLDRNSLGKPGWNPLGALVRPGETVLLKPNLVKESHPRDPDGWKYVLTHGSVIRAVSDYLWKALGPSGRIIVADAPQTDSSFKKISEILQLESLRLLYRSKGLNFSIVDLRKEEWLNEKGVITARHELAGDPEGYIKFDLADSSEFQGHLGTNQYYGADYYEKELNSHHSHGRHDYLIAGTAIKADVVFSLPKLKTHKKAGITVSLKNLIGVNGDKNWLPHHTEPSLRFRGDERPELTCKGVVERFAARKMRQLSLRSPQIGALLHQNARRAGAAVFGETESVVRSGNWWGNDTLWRTCLDLNKILFYGNPDGSLRSGQAHNRKRHYVLVDGIIAGDGSGPMNPDPVYAGLTLFGISAPRVDAACAILMGFDPQKIPILRHAFCCKELPLAEGSWQETQLSSNRSEWNGQLSNISAKHTFSFEPHFGWKGHIERSQDERASQNLLEQHQTLAACSTTDSTNLASPSTTIRN